MWYILDPLFALLLHVQLTEFSSITGVRNVTPN